MAGGALGGDFLTCFGLAAMTSSITFSIAPVSVTCFRPSRLDDGRSLARRDHLQEHVLRDLAR
jgi:hypothetical protein